METDGKPKGNCDADIVVAAMQDSYEKKFKQAVLVSSDGDYAPLVKFLMERNGILTVVSPYEAKLCSVLLKRTNVKIAQITEQRSILEEQQKEKAPDEDEPHKGLLRKE